MSRLKRQTLIFTAIVVLVLLLFSLLHIQHIYKAIWKQALPQRLLRLAPNANTHIFVQEGLIAYPKSFLFLARLFQWNKGLKQGTYQIRSGETIIQLIAKMKKADVYKQTFRIIEGTRWCDVLQHIQENSDFVFKPEMLQELSNPYPSLEGMLFPSTYVQAYGESILPVLQLAYKQMQMRLQEVWNGRQLDLPYRNPYELLIAASIIEKESSIETERELISSVIVNRLRLNMPLQMDPTIAYAIPGCQHVLLKGSDLKQDSPYNTYKHRGLPPSPICMVSMSALMAAAHPKSSQYLYFVANGQGGHVFSNEYQQQLQALRQYLRNTHAN